MVLEDEAEEEEGKEPCRVDAGVFASMCDDESCTGDNGNSNLDSDAAGDGDGENEDDDEDPGDAAAADGDVGARCAAINARGSRTRHPIAASTHARGAAAHSVAICASTSRRASRSRESHACGHVATGAASHCSLMCASSAAAGTPSAQCGHGTSRCELKRQAAACCVQKAAGSLP
jgi:hypothetical protein